MRPDCRCCGRKPISWNVNAMEVPFHDDNEPRVATHCRVSRDDGAPPPPRAGNRPGSISTGSGRENPVAAAPDCTRGTVANSSGQPLSPERDSSPRDCPALATDSPATGQVPRRARRPWRPLLYAIWPLGLATLDFAPLARRPSPTVEGFRPTTPGSCLSMRSKRGSWLALVPQENDHRGKTIEQAKFAL
jgi:hypothetical protein